MKRSALKGRARVASASGQALVSALIFLLVGSIGLYVAFNSFQMTSAKIKLQNTADAAAYSAAVLQARDYNFSAYTNRAMIANQVTAAQAVGLKSWIDDLDATYSHSDLDETVKGIAEHPDQWNTPKSRGKVDIGPVRATLDNLLPIVAKGIGSINRALSDAQANYHAAIFVAVPATADAVARQNQPDSHVTDGYFSSSSSSRTAVQLAAWQSYTRTVTPAGTIGNGDRFADLVTNENTLDDFVKNRNSTRSVAPDYQQLDDSAKVCRDGGRVTITVSHNGGTQLRTDKKGWQSIDASTAHVNVTCLYAFDAIAGSGGSANGNISNFMSRPPFAASEDWRGYGGDYNFGDHTSSEPGSMVSPAMAQQFTNGPGASLDAQNGGLLPYQDMSGTPVIHTAPRITVEVQRDMNGMINVAGAGRLKVDANPAGGVMRALASANAYFDRPNETTLGMVSGALLHADAWARADGATEFPSLFSPYWQAALAPVSASERSTADGTQISAGVRAQKP